MKKVFLLLLSVVALATSCVSRNLDQEQNELKGRVSLSLAFNSTKAYSDVSDPILSSSEQEIKIDNVVAIVYDGTAVDAVIETKLKDQQHISFDTKAGDKSITLLANVDQKLFYNCQNKTDVEAVLIELNQTSLLMRSDIPIFKVLPGNNNDSFAVLNRQAAKINIKSITIDKTLGSKLTITNVGIANNYNQWSLDNNHFSDRLGFNLKDEYKSDKSNYFYVFPDKNGLTKVVIQGLLNGESVYYPIFINKAPEGTNITGDKLTGIVSNAIYNLTVNIKSKGTTDPNGEIDPSIINVGISVADWSYIVNQNVNI